MSMETPDSYKTGIQHIEGLGVGPMAEWLRAELHEESHVLAGQPYDYPVQPIVNHHPYLSPEAQKRMAVAIEALVLNWKQAAGRWSESAGNALLNLVEELPVVGAKSKLQSLIGSQEFSNLAKNLQLAMLGSIATLSTNDDRRFWNDLPNEYPQFAGMAFQVLTRIAPGDALPLLGHLSRDEQVIGSVARKLPDFISHFEPEVQAAKLRQIYQALTSLPIEASAPLKLALKEAGFELVEIPSILAEKQKTKFLMLVDAFVPKVHKSNVLELQNV